MGGANGKWTAIFLTFGERRSRLFILPCDTEKNYLIIACEILLFCIFMQVAAMPLGSEDALRIALGVLVITGERSATAEKKYINILCTE